MLSPSHVRIAILDHYPLVAPDPADRSPLKGREAGATIEA